MKLLSILLAGFMPVVPGPYKGPSEEEFRKVGFTAEAANHPRDLLAMKLLCAFNGIEVGQAPPAWWYYPSASSRDAWRRVAAVVEKEKANG